MKGYFFEGDMELNNKRMGLLKRDYSYQEQLGTNTLLLIKKYGELRRQIIDALETKIFSLKSNLFSSKHPAADCICTARSILLVIF